MVAAELVAEALPEIRLGVPVPPRAVTAIRTHAEAHPARLALLSLGDELGLAHPREHHVAALDGAVKVGPRRQRGRGPCQPGDERALRDRQRLGGLAEHALRHRFHAVDTGAQIDAIEV